MNDMVKNVLVLRAHKQFELPKLKNKPKDDSSHYVHLSLEHLVTFDFSKISWKRSGQKWILSSFSNSTCQLQ